jgi:hypothetical protein
MVQMTPNDQITRPNGLVAGAAHQAGGRQYRVRYAGGANRL